MTVHSRFSIIDSPVKGDEFDIETSLSVYSDSYFQAKIFESSLSTGWLRQIKGVVLAIDTDSSREIRINKRRFLCLRDDTSVPLSEMLNKNVYLSGDNLNIFPFSVDFGEDEYSEVMIHGKIFSNGTEENIYYKYDGSIETKIATITNEKYEIAIMGVYFKRASINANSPIFKGV